MHLANLEADLKKKNKNINESRLQQLRKRPLAVERAQSGNSTEVKEAEMTSAHQITSTSIGAIQKFSNTGYAKRS